VRVTSERIEAKTPEQIRLMRAAGLVVADALDAVRAALRPGVTTLELDGIAEHVIRSAGAAPSFRGYGRPPYPATTCISVNDEVVHGIPSVERRLAEGDVVGLDFGVVADGWFGDAARTVPVGRISADAARLLAAGIEALRRAVAAARPGATLGDVGAAVQAWVEGQGFSVVRDFVGHGIGRRLHEPPHVPNYGEPGTGERLRPGMVLALEPMLNAGGPEVETLDDGWTAVTADGSLSAHFEHTVAVTENGPVVLGLPGVAPRLP